MHADLILIILAALVVLAVVYRGLAWMYLPPVDLPGPARVRSVSPNTARIVPVSRAGKFQTEDDDWADQLHEINLAVSHKVWSWFQQKMVPVSEITHYEVEALIRTLAVPEWVPDRYRVAA